jgi:hypothetical protein
LPEALESHWRFRDDAGAAWTGTTRIESLKGAKDFASP